MIVWKNRDEQTAQVAAAGDAGQQRARLQDPGAMVPCELVGMDAFVMLALEAREIPARGWDGCQLFAREDIPGTVARHGQVMHFRAAPRDARPRETDLPLAVQHKQTSGVYLISYGRWLLEPDQFELLAVCQLVKFERGWSDLWEAS